MAERRSDTLPIFAEYCCAGIGREAPLRYTATCAVTAEFAELPRSPLRYTAMLGWLELAEKRRSDTLEYGGGRLELRLCQIANLA
jgi:hypothetical protein